VFAASGLVLGAVYMLWMFQRVVFGPVRHEENDALEDLHPREIAVLVPVVAMIVIMGVYPAPFLETMEPSVKALVGAMEKHQQRAVAVEDHAPVQARGGV
jgi:NADH-quinone oxidoreductase subunit M